jgi:hypothetical protein
MTASQSFTQKLYDQAASADRSYMSGDGGAGGAGPADGPSDDEVVDAEIVDDEGKSA